MAPTGLLPEPGPYDKTARGQAGGGRGGRRPLALTPPSVTSCEQPRGQQAGWEQDSNFVPCCPSGMGTLCQLPGPGGET
jgi:hypothetical protein